ncbi:hypothetical protein ACGFNU_05645 [Spirillospora sp. NPDC048911]|uniref:hypothetical protein n=1 Tax=Spirillospora sp. NPDC048911 TaxID=3364527 RepID=UPI003715E3F2
MSTPPTVPAARHVLIIDDEPEEQQQAAAVLRTQGLAVAVRAPEEVTEDDLMHADVFAIDQYYQWAGDDPRPQQVAFSPPDGLALAGIVARRKQNRISRPPVVVLRTGHLDELAGGLPRAVKVPMMSAQYNIDWMLSKTDESAGDKLIQLADAADALRRLGAAGNQGAAWLAVPQNASWADEALLEVAVCRPPEHSMADYTHGIAWLRWFAHRVLPFPSFLVSDVKAAVLLGLSHAEFHAQVSDPASPLGSKIIEFRYTGELCDLVGRRWWRAGLETFAEDLLIDAPSGLSRPEMFAEAYRRTYQQQLRVLQLDRPVVTIDPDYDETGVEEAEDCLRLAPDFWPTFADEPWALREDLEDDPGFAELIARGDRGRLASAGALR